MPAYPGAANSTVSPTIPPTILYPGGDSGVAFNSENVAAPEASVAFQTDMCPGGQQQGIFVEIQFSANPGAFTCNIQEADTDNDSAYVTPSASAYTLTTAAQGGVNATGGWRVRSDLIPTGGKFTRLLVPTGGNPNGVNWLAKITRP